MKEGWKFSNFSFFFFFFFFSFNSFLFFPLVFYTRSSPVAVRSVFFFFYFSSLHTNPRHRLWTKLFVKVRRVFFNNTWPTLSLNALFHLGTLERAKASLMSLHPRKLVFNASARPTGSMNFSLEEGTLKVSVPFSTDSGSRCQLGFSPRSFSLRLIIDARDAWERWIDSIFSFFFFKKRYFSKNGWSFLKYIFNIYHTCILWVSIFE